jgi:hypothetical protein
MLAAELIFKTGGGLADDFREKNESAPAFN